MLQQPHRPLLKRGSYNMFEKLVAAILGFILYPLLTLVVALVHCVGFACFFLTGVLVFPSFISSLAVFGDILRQQNPDEVTADVRLHDSFTSYLARDLRLRGSILGVGIIALTTYAFMQTVIILKSPFDGIKAGLLGGFSDVLSGVKKILFDPFHIHAFINRAELRAHLEFLARTAGIDIAPPTDSKLPLTDAEINSLTYRLHPEHDKTGYDHAVASWTHKLGSSDNATCGIFRSIPTQDNIVLLQQQYFHNSRWNPIQNLTWVFSRTDLIHQLKTNNSLNPMNRANLRDTTSKYTHEDEACDTRWRIIPFCDQNTILINKLQALHETEQNIDTSNIMQPNATVAIQNALPSPVLDLPGPETNTPFQLYTFFSAINPFQVQITIPNTRRNSTFG